MGKRSISGEEGGRQLARRGESLLETLVYNSAIRDQYLSRLADPSSSLPFHPPFLGASFH